MLGCQRPWGLSSFPSYNEGPVLSQVSSKYFECRPGSFPIHAISQGHLELILYSIPNRLRLDRRVCSWVSLVHSHDGEQAEWWAFPVPCERSGLGPRTLSSSLGVAVARCVRWANSACPAHFSGLGWQSGRLKQDKVLKSCNRWTKSLCPYKALLTS